MLYLFVFLLLLLLTFHFDIQKNTKYRNEWFFAVLIIFILISGLRWRIGSDTTNNLYGFYHYRPDLESFSFKDYPIGKDPFFILMNSIIISLGGRFYIVQLLHSIFVNTLIFKYIRRHSRNIFTCILLYALIIYFDYNTETMRASMSIVICLFANDFFLDHKWIKGYILLFLALMFHAQTIIMLIIPLFLFLRLNRVGIFVLLLAFIGGQIAKLLIGDYILLFLSNDEIKEKAIMYMGGEEFNGSLNIMGIIANTIPKLLYSLGPLYIIKKHGQNNYLTKLEPFLMIYCIFVMIQAGFFIAYRYEYAFMIYAIFFYAEGFVQLARSRKFSRAIALVRSIVIFSPIIWGIINFYFSTNSQGYKAYIKYYPYKSIFDRTIVDSYENEFGRERPANDNEF